MSMERSSPTSAPINSPISGSNWKRRMAGSNLAEPQSRPRLPGWLRLPLPTSNTFALTRSLLDELKLHTVCESARCPNHWECWSRGTATFMIAGDRCTRACGFCAVTTARPFTLEADEPERVAEASRRMRLNHVVITAVARDDLADGGADHFRRTIEAVRALNPHTIIEVLTPDFNDRDEAIEAVIENVRTRGEHCFDGFIAVVEVRREDFDDRVRIERPHCLDGAAEMIRATIREVVARDGSNHDMIEPHPSRGFGDALGFVGFESKRPGCGYRAKPARPGATVAGDHERGGASAPAFPMVWAPCAFADGVEF